MGVTLPTRTLGVLLGVETTDPRPLANQLEGPGGKSVAKYGAEGRIRTGMSDKAQRFLRPPRLPFRHFGMSCVTQIGEDVTQRPDFTLICHICAT